MKLGATYICPVMCFVASSGRVFSSFFQAGSELSSLHSALSTGIEALVNFRQFLECCQPTFALALCLTFISNAAHARFEVCNQSLDVVNVAVGLFVDKSEGEFVDSDPWETRGWWTIGPNQCADLLRDELHNRWVYVYARDVFDMSLLEGDTELCVLPEKFVIDGAKRCLYRHYIPVGFLGIDTRASERWTLYLTTEG